MLVLLENRMNPPTTNRGQVYLYIRLGKPVPKVNINQSIKFNFSALSSIFPSLSTFPIKQTIPIFTSSYLFLTTTHPTYHLALKKQLTRQNAIQPHHHLRLSKRSNRLRHSSSKARRRSRSKSSIERRTSSV